MDTAVCHPLPDFLFSDYSPPIVENILTFYLFRNVPVNPHLRALEEHPITWPVLVCSSLFKRESPDCPSLRASSDHRFIVGALRARRAPGRSLPLLLRPRVPRAGGRLGYPPFSISLISSYFRRADHPPVPPGLSLASVTGVISGTPTAASDIDHDFTVRDSTNQTATKQLNLRIRH